MNKDFTPPPVKGSITTQIEQETLAHEKIIEENADKDIVTLATIENTQNKKDMIYISGLVLNGLLSQKHINIAEATNKSIAYAKALLEKINDGE